MPKYRMQVAMAADSLLARDQLINTLYFDDGGVLTNPENLCKDLADAFDLGWNSGTPDRQTKVSCYVQGTPGPPVAEFIKFPNLAPASATPREVSLCLSYFSGTNSKRNRGRVFLPYATAGGQPNVRPVAAHLAAAQNMASRFAALGGVDVDWCVYSRADDAFKPVTGAWVDDEWDRW